VGNRIRLFPTYPLALDRGDIATGGEADGEGELVPPPLSPTLQPSYFSPPPHPARAFVGIPMRFCRHPPPRPRLRRSSPTPSWGRGPCVAISGEQPYLGWSWWETVSGVEPAGNRIWGGAGGKPYPGWSRWATVPSSSPGSPHVLDRGDIATGGEADGEGELVPPPLSPALQPSYFSPASPTSPAPSAGRLPVRSLPAPPTPPAPPAGRYPYPSAGTPPPRPRLHEGYPDTSPAPPTPPAPAALLPRPLLGAGSVRGDIR